MTLKLLCNHKVRGSHYRKTKAFSTLQMLQLLAISVIVAVNLSSGSKRSNEVAKPLESILEQDCYKKILTDQYSEFVKPHIKKVLLKYNQMLYHSRSPP